MLALVVGFGFGPGIALKHFLLCGQYKMQRSQKCSSGTVALKGVAVNAFRRAVCVVGNINLQLTDSLPAVYYRGKLALGASNPPLQIPFEATEIAMGLSV